MVLMPSICGIGPSGSSVALVPTDARNFGSGLELRVWGV